jgi:hypothetical protein
LADGALLQYSESATKWMATTNIDTLSGTLRLNGGTY